VDAGSSALSGLIFDLNGTLIERRSQSPYIRELVRRFCSLRLGHEVPPFEPRDGAPMSTRTYLQRTLLSGDGDPMSEFMDWEARHFDPTQLKPAPGAVDVLDRLRRSHRLALVTNNVRPYADAILDARGWTSVFAYVGTLEIAKKPDPEAFLAAFRALGLEPRQCCAIGDKQAYDVDPVLALNGTGHVVPWGGLRQLAETLL